MERKEINTNIYNNVKALAKAKGVKLQDFAKSLNISVGYISRIEKNISVEVLMKISKFFNVSMEDLVNKDFKSEFDYQIALSEFYESIDEVLQFMSKTDVLAKVASYLEL